MRILGLQSNRYRVSRSGIAGAQGGGTDAKISEKPINK
jgi:hypothetical protein